MDAVERKYPQFSACGLNCGLCPQHYTDGPSRCPGCGARDFHKSRPKCGVLSCARGRGLEFCFECDDFPCKRYDGADRSDSFITHKNQFGDMEKAQSLGPDAYMKEQDEKARLLTQLLESCNDGRRKSFLCLAVNLLPLDDIEAVLERLASDLPPEAPVKERAAEAFRLFSAAAESRGVTLKLRKAAKP